MGRKKKFDTKEEKTVLSNTMEKAVLETKDYSKLPPFVYVKAIKDSQHLISGDKYRVGCDTARILLKQNLVELI